MTFPTLILALTWTLNWQAPASNPGLTSYVIERQIGPSWVPVDTILTAPGACIDSFPGAFNEVWHIKGRALHGTRRSDATVHLLAIDWAPGDPTAVLFWSSGGLPHTAAGVWLPAREWTCTYAFQDSSPVWIRCTCDFDYDHDGQVRLSDLVKFAKMWVASGHNLSLLADFGGCYQAATKVWP